MRKIHYLGRMCMGAAIAAAMSTPSHVMAQLTQADPSSMDVPFTFMTFDNNVKGQLYAFSYGYGQAYVSSDNGEKWRLAMDFEDYFAGTGIVNSIRDFKPGKNPDMVFFLPKSNAPEGEGIFAVNHKTGEIKHYPVPDTGYYDSWFTSFDVFDEKGDVIIADVNFRIDMTTIRSMVFLTKDGGKNWTPVYRNWESDFVYPAKVAFCPGNQSRLYIFRGNGPSGVNGGILISDDEGKTWRETLPGHSLATYAFNPKNPEEIYVGTTSYAAHEAVFHSIDGGETWEQVELPWTPFILNNVIDIAYDRLDPNNIIVVEENQIFVTSDGFRTFTDVAPVGYMWGTMASVNPFNSGDVVLGVDMNGIIRSDDRLQTQRMLTEFKVDSYCGDVAVAGSDIFYLRSGRCRMAGYRRSVAGNYVSLFADKPGSRAVFAYDAEAGRLDRIVFGDEPEAITVSTGMGLPAGVVACGTDGRYVAAQGGKLYALEISGDSPAYSDLGVDGVVSLAADGDAIYAATSDKILVSRDGGRVWDTDAVPAGNGQIANVSAGGGTLLALTDAGMYLIDMAASGWTRVESPGVLPAFASVHGNTIVVRDQRPDGLVALSYTRDGGLTWKSVSEKDFEYCHADKIGFYPGEEGEPYVYLASSDMGLLKYRVGSDPLVIPDPVLPGNTDVRSLTARIVSDGSCDLSWLSPEGHYDAVYNVYRDNMKIADGITARSLQDKNLPAGEHTWRVTAVYEDGETSGIEAEANYTGQRAPVSDLNVTLDNLINGDAVAVLTWNLPEHYDKCGYNVYRDGTLVAGGLEKNSYTDRDLVGGRHEWTVAALYGETESQHTAVSADIVNSCSPVRDLEAYFDIKERVVDLEWDEPGDLPAGWLSRCGEPAAAYGPTECQQYDIVAATHWSAAELERLGLVGSSLTDVTFVPMSERARYFARVWIGSENHQPADEYIIGNLIGIDGKVGEWNVVSGNPIEIPEGKDLWIGVGVQYAGTESPIGMDDREQIKHRNFIRDWFNKPLEYLEDYDRNSKGNFCLGARFRGRDGSRMNLAGTGSQSDVTYEVSRDGEVIATTSEPRFSEGSLEERNYTYAVMAMHGEKGNSPEVDVEIFAGNKCPKPSDISVDASGKDVQLSWKSSSPQLVQETILEEHFDGDGMPQGWSLAEKDGDGYNWTFMRWDLEQSGFMMSELLVYSETGEVYNLSPDNWLISPKINISGVNGKLVFYVSAAGMWMNQTYYEVLVSTTGADPDDFTLLNGEVLELESTIWLKKVVDLSTYSGDIYIAVRHKNNSGDNCMALYFDDITVSHEVEKARRYNVYRDGMLIAGGSEGTSFTDRDCPDGDHEWTVTTVCDEYECESDPLTVSATVSGSGVENVKESPDAIYYDGRHKAIIVYSDSQTDGVRVYDVAGNMVDSAAQRPGIRTVIYTDGYAAGVYVVKCGSASAKLVID